MLFRLALFFSVATLFVLNTECEEGEQNLYQKKFVKINEEHPNDASTSKSKGGIPGKSILKFFLGIFKALQKLNPFHYILKLFGSHKKSGGLENKIQTVLSIYPGTKWCGAGDRAKNESDLGKHFETDACCRKHDACPDYINPGMNKYGLKNTGLFRRSSCQCDGMFYNCLKQVNSTTSKHIGFAYFDVAKPQCFKKIPCEDGKKCKSGHAFFDNPKF